MRTIIISLFESLLRRYALTPLRRFILPILAFGLFWAGTVQAQVGTSISADGSAPNNNAMLDVQSPATGDGKGMLIPRVTLAQRTTASSALDGGLLDNSGNLRGGAAQGLIVYQTNGSQGLFFNTSLTPAPAWVYLGNSTTNYLPLTGGTMSGALNMGAQVVTNVAHIDFNGNNVSVGRGAYGSDSGVAVGNTANGYQSGAAMGGSADGSVNGAAVGALAKGTNFGAALGRDANGNNSGAAMGYLADGSSSGAAVGREANGNNSGAAMGYLANGSSNGAAMGYQANGSTYGAAVGYNAKGTNYGVAVGYVADGYNYGVAVGWNANGSSYGAAVGYNANGFSEGAAVGREAKGTNYGAAMGREAIGSDYGAAVGYRANGARTNVAIGMQANAQGGTEQIAIGHNVTNDLPNTARIRGTLYLDGGTGIVYRATHGAGDWTSAKAFTIPHPLDPENKVLRHFCMEGPQVWNVYAGNAQLVNGQAMVELPDYYSALNLAGSEIYGLTSLGDAFVWIAARVSDNCFVIAGKQDIEVSWTIKVLRNDPGCLEDLRRRPVEQLKNEIR